MSFWSLADDSVTKDHYSPRFWLLWPGVLLMIAVSFTELVLQYKVFVYVTKAVWRGINGYVASISRKTGRSASNYERRASRPNEVRAPTYEPCCLSANTCMEMLIVIPPS